MSPQFGQPLSPRESRVLQLLALGNKAPAIARQEHVAVETVKTQLRHAYAKLGARNATHAVALAYGLEIDAAPSVTAPTEMPLRRVGRPKRGDRPPPTVPDTATRRANQVIGQVAAGMGHVVVRDIVEHARANPRQLADVVMVLAQLAGESELTRRTRAYERRKELEMDAAGLEPGVRHA